jgi:hypothetical protein
MFKGMNILAPGALCRIPVSGVGAYMPTRSASSDR